MRRLFLLFSALIFVHPAMAQKVIRDLPYTVDPTGVYEGDLYLPAHPESSAPFAALVLVHGGAWRSGHKSQMRRLAKNLAARGYASFSINYDKQPRSFPYSWQESRDAVRYLRDHAGDYHLDPARIGILGESAGGQLAALTTLAPNGPAVPRGGTSSDSVPVAATVIYNGGYDAHPKSWILRRYLGATCEKNPVVCLDASPIAHVHPGITTPFFVGHGDRDHLIPYVQATDFIAELQKDDVPVTPFVAHGGGHNYWRKNAYRDANFSATLTFLNTNLAAHP